MAPPGSKGTKGKGVPKGKGSGGPRKPKYRGINRAGHNAHTDLLRKKLAQSAIESKKLKRTLYKLKKDAGLLDTPASNTGHHKGDGPKGKQVNSKNGNNGNNGKNGKKGKATPSIYDEPQLPIGLGVSSADREFSRNYVSSDEEDDRSGERQRKVDKKPTRSTKAPVVEEIVFNAGNSASKNTGSDSDSDNSDSDNTHNDHADEVSDDSDDEADARMRLGSKRKRTTGFGDETSESSESSESGSDSESETETDLSLREKPAKKTFTPTGMNAVKPGEKVDKYGRKQKASRYEHILEWQRKLAEKKREEKAAREKEIEERNASKVATQKRRQAESSQMLKRTRKGQPVLSGVVDVLLDRIRSSK